MKNVPKNIELIGNELAILWEEGKETYLKATHLRQHSPSAENIGEKDIFGTQYGGEKNKEHSRVQILGWDWVGNYGIQIEFSDGHRTGIFSWDYLQKLESI